MAESMTSNQFCGGQAGRASERRPAVDTIDSPRRRFRLLPAVLPAAGSVDCCGLAGGASSWRGRGVVRPATGVADCPGHHHVLSVSPPNQNILQQLPVPRSELHRGVLLPHRQAERFGHQEAVFSGGSQEKKASFVSAGDPVRTLHSTPVNTVCPDADIEVTDDNQLILLRHRRQEGVQALIELCLRLVRAGHW
ncbi:hypothetical protein SprV_0200791400 [Sparganum proliferum]